jgi:hypothetical protein
MLCGISITPTVNPAIASDRIVSAVYPGSHSVM